MALLVLTGWAIQGTVLWLYYEDLVVMEAFWEEMLGRGLIVDQGWAKVFEVSSTGFVGLVDGSRGLHQATDLAGVTVSIITGEVEDWFERAKDQSLSLRTEELTDESGMVQAIIGIWEA